MCFWDSKIFFFFSNTQWYITFEATIIIKKKLLLFIHIIKTTEFIVIVLLSYNYAKIILYCSFVPPCVLIWFLSLLLFDSVLKGRQLRNQQSVVGYFLYSSLIITDHLHKWLVNKCCLHHYLSVSLCQYELHWRNEWMMPS